MTILQIYCVQRIGPANPHWAIYYFKAIVHSPNHKQVWLPRVDVTRVCLQESQLQINPHGIVALGPELDLDAPHGRDKLGQSTRAEATAWDAPSGRERIRWGQYVTWLSGAAGNFEIGSALLILYIYYCDVWSGRVCCYVLF